MSAPELPACLVMRRLWLPPERREAYRALVAQLAERRGELLARVELYEDAREGFYLELHLYRDVGAWSAVKEGAAGELSELLDQRRALVPDDHEEVTVHHGVIPSGLPGA